jgi:hypothetical protein
LPARIERMIALLLAHRDLLCAYETGSLELHFRSDSIKLKLVVHPEG